MLPSEFAEPALTVSPKMTIESIDPKSYKVTCVWFVHHKCRTKEFEENELEVCE